MKKTKSLVFQTFIFAGILILTVLLISFTTLYLLLPSHYFSTKEKQLENNAILLTERIQSASSEIQLAKELSQFSVSNNADVFSFNKNGDFIPRFSVPYINLSQTSSTPLVIEMEDAIVVENSKAQTVYFNENSMANESIETFVPSQEVDISWRITTNASIATHIAEEARIQRFFTASSEKYAPQMLMSEFDVDSPFMNTIQIVGTLQPINEASTVIFSLLPIVLILSLTIGLALAYLYAKKISKPVLELSSVAQQMQELSPDTTSTIKSENELGLLSDNLNQLYQKLTGTISILEEETQQVRHLERSKTQLMQSASHELKTPVAALKGITEGMIDKVGVYNDRDKYLLESKRQIDRLSRLVQEIILATQGEGEVQLIPEDIHLPTLISLVLEEQKLLIEKKGLEISKELLDSVIVSDYALLKRSLSNLLSNAVRHAPAKSTLTITLKESEKDLEFILKNASHPLSGEDLKQLTDPFYTLSYSRSKEAHGTGLGLYIVAKNLDVLKLPLNLDYVDQQFVATITFS